MKSLGPIVGFLLASSSASTASHCLPLNPGQSLKAVLSSRDRACYEFTVGVGEGSVIRAEQPIDLELRLTGNRATALVDAFESGTETVTIETPGQYQVEIRPVHAVRAEPMHFLLSRIALPLPQASTRRAAEEAGTKSKRSGNAPEIEFALAIWMRTEDFSAIGRTYVMRGEAAYAAEDIAAARKSFEQALDPCQSAGDIECVAEAKNDGGWAAQQLGDFEQARKLLMEAAVLFRQISNRTAEGQVLSNLGLLHQQSGEYQQAISYYDRANAILRSRNAVANARVLNNLGACYQYLAEYELAANDFGQALREFAAHHSWKDAVRAKLNLGRTYVLEGNRALGRKTLNSALAEATMIPDRMAEADTLDNLGQTFLGDGDASHAQSTLERALTLHRALGDKRMEAIDLHYLGESADALGDTASARDYLNQAFEIRRAIGLRDAASDSLFALARLEAVAGNPDTARELAGRALIMLESVRNQVPGPELRASFVGRKRRFFDLLINLEVAPGNPHNAEDSLLAAERGRGRALMDLLAEGRLLQGIPKELLDRRTNIQRQIDLLAARLSAAPPGLATVLRRAGENLVSEDEQIEASIHQSLSNQKLGQPLESVNELQTDLPSDSALLEYYLAENESYLWLVQTTGVQLFRLPARAAIESQAAPVLQLFPEILDRKRSPDIDRRFQRALVRLSHTLIGPIETLRLPGRLIIVPDGVLTRIPFAAFELSGKRRLGLVHDLVVVPSAAYLGVGQKPRRVEEFPKVLLAFADPVYSRKDPRVAITRASAIANSLGPDLARLPFNGELDTAAALIPAGRRQFLTGFRANVESLKTSRLQDYAVVHFSAHALIDDRIPELSRIALSMVGSSGRVMNGFVRPYQLSQLHLNGSTVVLSACDTALGKQVLGEGLAGFTTSLFSAGASQLLLALSPIDAEASSEFLGETYRYVFGSARAPMDHAVTMARRALARSVRWSDPYYWASFNLYGRPSETNLGP